MKMTKNEAIRCRFNTINTVCLSIFNDKHIRPTARLVWLILWRNARPDGKVRLSYNRIAEETGLSRRHCVTLVDKLIEQGLLKLLKKGRMPDRANLYAIKIYPPST